MLSGKMHDLGSKHISDLEKNTITTMRNLDFSKEEMYIHPSMSLLRCNQLLGLECIFLEDRMRIFLKNPIHNYMSNVDHENETKNAPLWRSATL